MLRGTLPTTLLEMLCKSFLDSAVIVKRIINPDDNF